MKRQFVTRSVRGSGKGFMTSVGIAIGLDGRSGQPLATLRPIGDPLGRTVANQ